jgi:hypothetical protein
MEKLQCLVVHGLTPNARSTIRAGIEDLSNMEHVNATYINGLGPLVADYANESFDLVIFTPELLAVRSNQIWKYVKPKLIALANAANLAVVLPQDEYSHSRRLEKFINQLPNRVRVVGPCVPFYESILPKLRDDAELVDCLPGYIARSRVEYLEKFTREPAKKSIDIGTRVTKLSEEFGEAGQFKAKFAETLSKILEPYEFVIDISTEPEDIKTGNEWYSFLGNCRWTPISKGGAQYADRFGWLAERAKALRIIKRLSPDFKMTPFSRNKSGPYMVDSPRLFEAVSLRTGLIMPAGSYSGNLMAGIDYLVPPIDHSEFEVSKFAAQLNDDELLLRLTNSAYQKLIDTSIADPENFLKAVYGDIARNKQPKNSDSQIDPNESIQRVLSCIHQQEHSDWGRLIGALFRAKNKIPERQQAELMDAFKATRVRSGDNLQQCLVMWLKLMDSDLVNPEELSYPWATLK